jgi:hypothetical protein
LTSHRAGSPSPAPPTHPRAAGIYGPGRSALESVRRAEAELSGSQRRRGRQRYVSRAHVGDIAAALLASMRPAAPDDRAEGPPGAGASGRELSPPGCVDVFNVADDEPAGRDEVEAHARRLLGLPEPPGGGEDESGGGGGDAAGGVGDASGGGGGGRGGALEEKRVSNARLKARLGLRLMHPTYREGLSAIAAGDWRPFLGPGDVAALKGRPTGEAAA